MPNIDPINTNNVADTEPLPPTTAQTHLPDREDFIASLPFGSDSGRLLEQDRS